MDKPSLRELTAVEYLCEHKNFRKAAAQLNVTPSALSHTIRNLEKRLGVRLFNRTTRSVAATDAGYWLANQSEKVTRELNLSLEGLSDFREGVMGRLRINAGPLASAALIRANIGQFLQDNTALHLDLQNDGRMIDIIEHGFDAGIRLLSSVPQDMVAVPFGRERRHVCVVAPGYLENRAHPVVPQDLVDHNCIRYQLPNGKILRWSFANEHETYKLDVTGAITLNSVGLMLTAAVEGVGIAYVPEEEAELLVKDKRLIEILPNWGIPRNHFALYYSQNQNTPKALSALAKFLRRQD